MRASIIHVTDHAIIRWKQRVSDDPRLCVYTIIDAVKEARIIKKDELLPFRVPRQKNSMYAVYNDVLFILESLTIDEYNLITIITDNVCHTPKIKKQYKIHQRHIPETKKKRKKLPARNKRVQLDDD